jgi:N-acetyl-alpha-D-glucosaminyl L-malate synthase BshA
VKIGITCYPTYGGSGVVATHLGLALAERGHEVHFVSYAQPFRLGGFRERVFFHGVEMEDYPLFEHPPYSLALAVALHDTARKHGLDLVHMHYAIPHAASAYLARQMLAAERPLKIVTTLHGTDITLLGLHPSFHAITRFSILESDGLSAVSSYLRDETVRDFSVPASRIDVIPNFIDTRVWHPDVKPCHRSKLAPGGEKIVMHVSNFRALKRVEDVVEIFARIERALPARLIMVGDGPDRPRALQRAAELGLQDKVLFLGKHQSVEELLACCDLFVLPSETESFGLAALEAMACGAPVLTSAVGGLPELVSQGVTGFLRPVGDIEAMAEAGIAILADDELRRAMSHAGIALARDHFSADAIVPRYEALYERVVNAQ